MRLSFLIIIAAAVLLQACKNNNNNNTSPAVKTQAPANDTSSVFGNAPAKSVDTAHLSPAGLARQERISHYQKVYKEALKAGDPYTQLIATYNLMADDSGKQRPYIDSLSSLYARLNMAGPAMKMADRVLALDPRNKLALEIKAGASVGVGKAADAISTNRKLYQQTKDVKYLFAIAEMQLQSQDLNGLDKTVNQIAAVPNLSKQYLEMQSQQPGQTQKIPGNAVLEYLKGIIALAKNEKAMAEIHLHKAVQISPKFAMAQGYLDAMAQQSNMPQQGH
jgi:tetratricopeptide (TPR) repeat protein